MARSVSFLSPSMPSNLIHMPEKMEVKLTEVEDQLCTLLDDCRNHLAETQGKNTTCRVAGGWVRDKLLGSQSHDMDIALSDMMGYDFAVEFAEYAEKVKDIPVKSIAKVKGNPGQSKHLETAKTVFMGIELDFVNLRDEEYADESRIPTKVTFGTPLQDALRRDITINTLFYNVHTRSVEDHCGKGLDDLRNGIIRTPLEPRQTFLDDPLRVIRCVRFASRFGFTMVPELEESARDVEIQTAITQKITRERVGDEIDKMMSGRDPLRSIQLIHSLSLFPTIFYIPTPISSTLSSRPTSSSHSVASATILHALLNPSTSPFSYPPLHDLFTSHAASSPSTIARLYLSCALTPYHGITYTGKKNKTVPAVEAAIREGLKIGTKNHYLDGIPSLFAAADLLRSPKLDDERFTSPSERVAIGLLLRNTSVHNPLIDAHWTVSLLFSLVQELVPLYDSAEDSFDVDTAASIIETYNDFVTRITELGLDKSVDSKPILDGHSVCTIVGAAKPGIWTGFVLSEVVKWQLDHPEGTKEVCAEWLKEEFKAGRIVVADTKASSGGKKR